VAAEEVMSNTASEPWPVEWVDSGSFDPRKLRDLFGTYLTGVTVVTARNPDGTAVGFTANSFTSVSLEPPLISVCVGHHANSRETLCRSTRFAVNILAERQKDVSAAFASSKGPKFSAVESWSREGGPPLIRGALSSMECETRQVIEAGDHSIVVGSVTGFHRSQGQPLGFYAGRYTTIGIAAEAVEKLEKEAIRIGCLIESEGKVLLVQKRGGENWEIPAAPLSPGQDHRLLLPRLLEALGVQAEITALFSLYQDRGHTFSMMLFRGIGHALLPATTLPDGARLKLFAEHEVPYEAIRGRSTALALRRYFKERAESQFGIYWDTLDGGSIVALDQPPKPWHRPPPGPPASF
jgi:flavin reductase (DIM6/NTAB) family NADH-FMN oxidoreductase RutF